MDGGGKLGGGRKGINNIIVSVKVYNINRYIFLVAISSSWLV